MRSRSVATRAPLLAVLAALTTLAPTAATVPADETPRVWSVGGLTVAAPRPGHGVVASALTADGSHLELVLETDPDGRTADVTVSVEAAGAAAAAWVRTQGGDPACSDGAYNLLPIKRTNTWDWWFSARTTPAELSRSKAEAALKSAVRSITGERNDCGRADHVSATSSYRGRTTVKPGVRSDGGCSSPDGKNVVGFGALPNGVLALTCTVYQLTGRVHPAVESDVLFNKRWFDWATTRAGCTNQIMLRSVATHEFGHVYGLNHVSEDSHPTLTMSPRVGACDDSAWTLGKGDMLGLEKRY